ncbi:hypothetical protein XA68_16352 [Ophiocordyceps unilateralis]|uniref:Conserved oligomeric Golgi complex subunit 1 n=1 Tax=Ophiocordyceps unilateralis TaxID=268505 RepID=A0A2A9P6P4_OPHUN|nr:hypothetical protein XA68_16352 [Ophiocordyceps unilateralis]
MASTRPDLSTFTSSAQIFSAKHTLPQIRAIHSSLRAEIDDRSSRLRTQVGGSYRDLLGTADAIVQMRHDTGRVQQLLSGMGGRCGRGFVSAKTSGLASFAAGEDDAFTSTAVRWELLDACLLLVGRILRGQGVLDDDAKGGQRLVMATKVWVLGRLLIKSLDEEVDQGSVESGTARRLEASKKAIASLRRRLLSCVRKALDRADDGAQSNDVLEPLCAYSLVTSSGARDVLRHFLSVRGEAMTLAFVEEDKTAEDVLRSLKLYTTTLLQVQALVPAKLSPALAQLKSQLLADAHLQRLEGLRLDVRQRWCGEEMQLFTPFVRHDDLDGQQARSMLGDWAAQGGRVNLEGLRKTLEHTTEPEAIIDLRTKVLRLWIRDGGRAKGFDPLEMQDDMRHVINSRLMTVLEDKVAALRLVGSVVEGTLDGWQDGVSDKLPGLWEEDGYDSALAEGAVSFVQEVATRLYGRSDAVSKAIQQYGSWMRVIDSVREALEQLKKQRWENDYDEIEDEETMEARQQALSRDDPRKLQEKLDASLDAAFGELDTQFGKLWDDKSGETTSGPMAMYMLRVLRNIRARLPDRPAAQGLGLGLVPKLHGRLVAHASEAALDDFAKAFLPDRRVAGKPLWEGEPALPNQPSAGAFRFLHILCQSMADAGIDLWSSTAVSVLKKYVCGRLVEAWRSELVGLGPDRALDEGKLVEGRKTETQERNEEEKEKSEEEKETEAEEKSEDAEKTETQEKSKNAKKTDRKKRDVAIQWLFDMSYLLCSVGRASGTTCPDLKSLEDEIYRQTGLDSESSRLRIADASHDYWQRTNLLFGLLA